MSNDNGIDIDQVVDDPPSIDIETSSAIRLQTSEDYSLEEVGLLPYEDIAWDLGRLEVKVDPTPSPTTPSPTTPSPTTPSPTTPSPTPSPTQSPQGTIVVPASPVPAPPTTLTPTLSSNDSETPTATATTTNTAVPTGTSYSPTTYYSPTTSPTITVTVNDEIVVANNVQTQTYYYCPPPPAKTIEARDTNGKNVVITIPPPVSSVVIDYTFQVQLNNNEVVMNGDGSEDDDGIIIMEDLLPQIQDRVGDSLGEYYYSRGQDNKTNGNENENENNDVDDASSSTTCGGYFVDDFRRRKLLLMNARTRRKNMANEDVQTRIIGVSSTENLTVDKDKPCVPRNKGCYVVQGEFEATYVGYNEAGVKSSISRAVKEEMVHGSSSSSSQASTGPEGEYEYNLQLLGTQDEEVGHTQTADSSIFSKLIGQWKEVLPETTEQKPTPYGMAILGVLGATFLVLCYVVFVKSDGAEKVKDQMKDRKEKRGAKKRALGEMSNQHHHSLENSSDYCYDLESVAIIDDDHHGTSSNGTYGGGEESTGVEVRSTRDLFGRNSAKVASAGGVVAASVQSKDGSRDSDKTKRISNRAGANASNYVGLQQLGSLIEVEESNSSNYGGGSNSSTSSLHAGPRQVSALDAGMSVHDSDDDVSSIGMTNFPPRKLSNKNNNTENDCTRRIIDRTPSCVTSATTTRASPVPTVNSQQIFQLPSISEAELAPPMNDTPRHHSSRMSTNLEVREQSGETSDESQEFEV